MFLTAIIGGSVVFLGNILLLFFFYRAYNRQKQALLTTLRAYFEAPNAETPSQFAMLTDAIATQAGEKLSYCLKSTFMGAQAGEAKNVKRLEGDILQDAMAQNSPVLAAIAQSFPAVSERLKGNPALLPLIMKMIPGLGVKPEGDNHEQSDFATNLNKWG